MNNLLCVCLIALTLTSCYDSELDATASVSENNIEYLDAGRDNTGLINDPYEIIGITPTSEYSWNVIVEYSGGCGTHQFVAWLPVDDESSSEISMSLFHNGNNDLCKAIVRDTIAIQLDRIISENQFSNIKQITMINPSNNRSIPVNLELAALTQSNSCFYIATSVHSSCATGVWEEQWFELEKVHSSTEKILLQPVANTNSVTLDTPDDGRYQIGMTLLFGHVQNSEVCNLIEGSLILPVAVNCLIEIE